MTQKNGFHANTSAQLNAVKLPGLQLGLELVRAKTLQEWTF